MNFTVNLLLPSVPNKACVAKISILNSKSDYGKIPYECRAYESVDNMSPSYDIPQKLTENRMQAAKG